MTEVLSWPNIIQECPLEQRQALYDVYNDLSQLQRWCDLSLQHISESLGFIISGYPKTNNLDIQQKYELPALEIVYPITLNTPLTLNILQELIEKVKASSFASSHDVNQNKINLAIAAKDGSIVYYNTEKGIKSPRELALS